ncbi:hypothetical protein SCMC78_20170 [Streptomyces sp. CMC78]|uniref:Uncharacterized protein n=1 Tax=Streptomyces sp. CMC78 TaxID=3231512 RepID=A0AB33KKX2_9ACTN
MAVAAGLVGVEGEGVAERQVVLVDVAALVEGAGQREGEGRVVGSVPEGFGRGAAVPDLVHGLPGVAEEREPALAERVAEGEGLSSHSRRRPAGGNVTTGPGA